MILLTNVSSNVGTSVNSFPIFILVAIFPPYFGHKTLVSITFSLRPEETLLEEASQKIVCL